jgi:hypothetical protein
MERELFGSGRVSLGGGSGLSGQRYTTVDSRTDDVMSRMQSRLSAISLSAASTATNKNVYIDNI